MIKKLIIFMSLSMLVACNGKQKTTPDKDATDNPPPLDPVSDSSGDYSRLLVQGKFKEIIDKTQKELGTSKDPAKLHYYAGFAWFRLKDNQKARDSFEKALAAGGNFADLYVNYSEVLFYLKDYAKAKEIITKAMGLFPKEPGLWYNMGGILFEENNPEEAIKYYNEALLRKDSYVPALISLGGYWLKKDPSKALPYFEKLQTIKGFEFEALMRSAFIHFKLRNWDKALDAVTKAEKINNTDTRIAKFRKNIEIFKKSEQIMTLAKQKKCPAAKTELKTLKEKYPDFTSLKSVESFTKRFCP
ncbi:tetratricopeptide repeat protein [Myxococcota bacterium]|nr:tetratricopeptide repeat protein [Myxococcota bacterium]MBU1382284.1 tetratricopeptide repeat protein [Myxococcota bacterium]MBU1495637.1 tetratricopeptide repeat protein [Myxococcota bacterium]